MRRLLALTWLLVFGLTSPPPAVAVDFVDDRYGAGFEDIVLAEGLTEPTGLAYDPAGRLYIAERAGRVWVVDPDGTLRPDPVLDISDHVNSYSERGLLGIEVEQQDFASHPYLYLLYTYEHDPTNFTGNKVSRLTRVRLTPDGTVPDPAEKILIGGPGGPPCRYTEPCIPADDEFHSVGTVRQDPADGTLYAGTGDANATGDYLTGAQAMRPFREDSLAGKIMRVDREGKPVDPPFCDDLDQACARVFAKGFRNPYRFSVRPGGGLVVADVGSLQAEEIDLVSAGGDFGWPCWEGVDWTSIYHQRDECQARYAQDPPIVWPLLWYVGHRAGQGAAVYAGPTYTGSAWPARFHDRFFYGDTVRGFLRSVKLDGSSVQANTGFADGLGYPVEMIQSPDGHLVYTEYGGTVKQIRYACDPLEPAPAPEHCNFTPVADIAADRTYGRTVETIDFSGAGSSDPDGDELEYLWDFGDGETSELEDPPEHEFAAGRHVVTLTVTDSEGRSATAQQVVFPGHEPPDVTIHELATQFVAGQTVSVRGSAHDADDRSQIGDADLFWTVSLRHDDHIHPRGRWVGEEATFETLDSHDADSGYVVSLTARSGVGFEATETVELFPKVVTVTLASDPPGALMYYGLREGRGPFTVRAAAGYVAPISAYWEVFGRDAWLPFSGWEHGAADQYTSVRIPDHDVTYTALYGSRERSPGEPRSPFQPPPFVEPPAPRPSARLTRLRPRRLAGVATAPLGVRRVSVAIARRAGRARCKVLLAEGRFTARARCSRRAWLRARLGRGKTTRRWVLKLPRRLPSGRYRVVVRVEDLAGTRARRAYARRLGATPRRR